jgi:N-glycosidase YbiA
MAIKFYRLKDPGGFMSNFWRARMFIYGHWWNFVEAPYQSVKTNILSEKDDIRLTGDPMEARLIGQKVQLVHNWDHIKREVMKECCLAKFLQHPDLRIQLMKTGSEELIEESPTDYFWGCGEDGTGQNVLGQVLMEVREVLRGE